MTYLEQYYKEIKEGRIIVGNEMRTLLDGLIEDLDNPKYIYDTTEANNRLDFQEHCCLQSKEPFFNKPIKFMLWQKAFWEVVYSFKYAATGRQRFKEILLIVARKNGKSAMLAADATYDLFMGDGGQDIVVASNDDKQAKLIWKEVYKFARKLDREQKIVHRNIVELENEELSTIIFRMSAKQYNQDGRNISKTLYDESHDSPNEDLAMNCWQAMSIKENPKFINCTTQGFIDEGLLDKRVRYGRAVINKEIDDDTFLYWAYTQDSEVEVFQDKMSWYKSNPSLGVIKTFEYMEDNLKKAKFEKSTRIHVLCKDFNIKQNSSESWLLESDVTYLQDEIQLEDFRDCYCFAGVDLSQTTDLTSAKIMFLKPNDNKKYIFSKYFIPETTLQKSDDKAAGAKYEEWARDGICEIHEGNVVILSRVAEWFKYLYDTYGITIFKLGYDQRYAKDFLDTMADFGYGSKRDEACEMINQSKYVMSVPMKIVEADLKSQLIHGLNDMDRWCLLNCGIEVDNQQFIMPVKTNVNRRIDGAVSLILCYAIFERYKSQYIKSLGGE